MNGVASFIKVGVRYPNTTIMVIMTLVGKLENEKKMAVYRKWPSTECRLLDLENERAPHANDKEEHVQPIRIPLPHLHIPFSSRCFFPGDGNISQTTYLTDATTSISVCLSVSMTICHYDYLSLLLSVSMTICHYEYLSV